MRVARYVLELETLIWRNLFSPSISRPDMRRKLKGAKDILPTDFVELGPKAASATILLAHGAGAPMDSTGMTALAEAFAAQDFRVVRFEFAYMAIHLWW